MNRNWMILALALALGGCGGETDSTTTTATATACTPGEQITCACPGSGQGAQRCEADGSGYGVCDCGEGGTTSSSGGAGGAGGGTGAGATGGTGGAPGDADGDGWFPADGDCNDGDPEVNPAAVDFPDGIDNDCDGKKDVVEACDGALSVGSKDATDALRAMGLCNGAWIVNADYLQANGDAPPDSAEASFHLGHGILDSLGSYYVPGEGLRELVLSSGLARGPNDPMWNPNYDKGYSSDTPAGSPICDGVVTGECHDSIELRTTIRIPPNAHGFSFRHAHLSFLSDYNKCTAFADVFRFAVSDVGVVNCPDGDIFTPNCAAYFTVPQSALVGTGFEGVGIDQHLGTPWLRTAVPAEPNSSVTVSWAAWDSNDGSANYTTVIDDFRWSDIVIPAVVTGLQ